MNRFVCQLLREKMFFFFAEIILDWRLRRKGPVTFGNFSAFQNICGSNIDVCDCTSLGSLGSSTPATLENLWLPAIDI